MKNLISRREALQSSASLLASAMVLPSVFKEFKSMGIGIGACDWSIGKNYDVGGVEVAANLGLDGLQVNMGSAANDMHLRDPKIQKQYLDAFKKYNIKCSGLGLGELNGVPYKSDPRTDKWVEDSIDVAKVLGVKVILLAFFYKNDLKNDPEGTKAVIEKFKKVMPKAEAAGVTFGIESWLNEAEHMHIINEVGSPNLRVYYDVANSTTMGYPIYDEIRSLGKQKMICEVHAKENDFLLGQGKVDFQEVKKCLKEIKYKGWMQIEGAIPPGKPMFESYVENLRYLRSVFPK